jgi:anthranilate synthase/aminodeoxychorismate synthase-like glutamine amidotransferase
VILLVDNYDSFVYNLARYFRRLGQQTVVVRNDAITVDEVRKREPQAIVFSPGPCTPDEAGCSLDLVREFEASIPMLGVCLGHQAIAAALGARIVRAPEPMHGRISEVFHDGQGVFTGLPNPLAGCRYHSLVVDGDGLPERLVVSARTADGVVMAIRHRQRPITGLQFHPESILTAVGYELLAGFLRQGGLAVPEVLPTIHNEWQEHGEAHDSRKSGNHTERRRDAEHLANGPAGRRADEPVCAPPLPDI